jgi:hypothetical protein
MVMLRKTLFVIALSGAGFALAPPAAEACLWTFGTGADGSLGTTFTQTGSGAGCTSTVTLTPVGGGAGNTLWNKNGGANETGIGLSNDPNLVGGVSQHEIWTTGGTTTTPSTTFVQIAIGGVAGLHNNLSISFNSVQAGDTWGFGLSSAVGVFGTLVTSGTDQGVHNFDAGASTFVNVEAIGPACAGVNPSCSNILLATFDGPEPSGVPEPASLTILGAALLGLGLVRRYRRTGRSA